MFGHKWRQQLMDKLINYKFKHKCYKNNMINNIK